MNKSMSVKQVREWVKLASNDELIDEYRTLARECNRAAARRGTSDRRTVNGKTLNIITILHSAVMERGLAILAGASRERLW